MPLVDGAEPALAGLDVLGVALAGGAHAGERRQLVVVRCRGSTVLELTEVDVGPGGLSSSFRFLQSLPVITARANQVASLLQDHAAGAPPPLWDVLELAGLLVPACPTDSLDAAGRHFGLAREQPGPAGEALLVVGLFGRLLGELARLETTTLLQASRLVAPLNWPLRSLFQEVERRRARDVAEGGQPFVPPAPASPPLKRHPLVPVSRPRGLDLDEVRDAFERGGMLGRAMPGYEPRAEQVRMAEAVAATLNDGGRLLVEAGTGTGKSLAYLLPAAMLALRNQWRVVVSTATTNLQDQLHAKDLHQVARALGADGSLRATVLKGRANYLCLQRWQELLQGDDLTPGERTLLLKTLFWVPRTSAGDRAELRLTSAEEEAWQRVCASADVCTPARCPFHRLGTCFLARARRAAEESHIVIANHALLLSDLANHSRILPEHQVLILDEAHHLEAEATAQLGWQVSERDLSGRLHALWDTSPGSRGGTIPEGLTLLRRADAAGSQHAAKLGPRVFQSQSVVVEVERSIRALYARLAHLLGELGSGGDDSSLTLRITGATRAGSDWEEVERVWADAMQRLGPVLELAEELSLHLQELPNGDDEARLVAAALQRQVEYWSATRERMDAAIHAPATATIYWLSGHRHGSAYMNAAPLDVSAPLSAELFDPPRAVALVSATLAVDGSFEYVQQRLGLQAAEAIAVGSPFDFRRAALVYLPYDVPDPTQPGYQQLLEEVLADTITRAGGRTLVLFTSRAHLRATHASLRSRLAAAGISLLAQGVDEASRTRLLQSFRHGRRVALLGTNAFWEGVDVVGEALSCVILPRLPFAVPSDPIYAARSEQFDDPFGQYAVPQAVLRFKQGFGRLIRSRRDRGAVVVLDRRILTRNYGATFLHSLPDCEVRQGPARGAGRAVEEWLAGRSIGSHERARVHGALVDGVSRID